MIPRLRREKPSPRIKNTPWTGRRSVLIINLALFAHPGVMLRLLIRFIGLLLLAAGFVACIVDGTRSLAGGSLSLTTLAGGLQAFDHAAYSALHAKVLERFPAFVWDPILASLLLAPLSVALCGLGGLFILFSHKPPPPIGYSGE